MCWHGRISEKKIANRDIPVFKILNKDVDGSIYSYFLGFPYKLNTLYTAYIVSIFYLDNVWVDITKGFHSYSIECPVNFYNDNKTLSVYDKCKKAKPSACIEYYPHGIKVLCIIPKNSIYYENEQGEIVSNQIILKEIER